MPDAEACSRDLPKAELHVLESGHFLLERQHQAVAALIDAFLVANKTG
ncbi:MAG: hypothetical protein ICV83_25590 [Cytophagales bacterium]|nr:hypothetical protein [Cytophagales bacterium]